MPREEGEISSEDEKFSKIGNVQENEVKIKKKRLIFSKNSTPVLPRAESTSSPAASPPILSEKIPEEIPAGVAHVEETQKIPCKKKRTKWEAIPGDGSATDEQFRQNE